MGVATNDGKDDDGWILELLGRLVDTYTFTASVPQRKKDRILHGTADVLARGARPWTTKKELERLVGQMSFCASVVQLGWAFCRRLWSFLTSIQHLDDHQKTRIPCSPRYKVVE